MRLDKKSNNTIINIKPWPANCFILSITDSQDLCSFRTSS
jgi:hypothetical protein